MRTKIIDFIVSGFYSGHFPAASGTAGTAVAMLLATIFYAVCPETVLPSWSLLIATLLTIVGILLTNAALEISLYPDRAHDPREVVIDEIAGYFVTIALLPKDPLTLILGFVAFRIFDIWKPFPIRRVEKLPRGYGIVLDDVVAGVYASVALHIMVGAV